MCEPLSEDEENEVIDLILKLRRGEIPLSAFDRSEFSILDYRFVVKHQNSSRGELQVFLKTDNGRTLARKAIKSYRKGGDVTENRSMDTIQGMKKKLEHFLLIIGGETVIRHNGENMTPLGLAAITGNMEDMRKTLEEEEQNVDDIHEKDDWKSTPLMLASVGGHLEIVKLLVEKGADVNKQNDGGCSALSIASRRGRLNVASYLIEKGANMWARELSGHNAISAARDGEFRFFPRDLKPWKQQRVDTVTFFRKTVFHNIENEEEAVSDDDETNSDSADFRDREEFSIYSRRPPSYDSDYEELSNTLLNLLFYSYRE